MIKNNPLLFSVIFMIIGSILILAGVGWMITDEPWMLDKIANEERLNMSFNELFNHPTNQTLPEYLKQIYRFFGLWVIIIGVFITSLSIPTSVKNKSVRLVLIFCVGLMSYGGLTLGYFWIPNSPFIYLGWILILLHAISIISHKKI